MEAARAMCRGFGVVGRGLGVREQDLHVLFVVCAGSVMDGGGGRQVEVELVLFGRSAGHGGYSSALLAAAG